MKRYFAIIALLALVSVPCFADSTSVPVTLVIEGYVEITADSAATITIKPTSTGGFASATIGFTVSCNVDASVAADKTGLVGTVAGAASGTTVTVDWDAVLAKSDFSAPGGSSTCELTATITGAPAANTGLDAGDLVLTTTP